jgi:hypothetical protein
MQVSAPSCRFVPFHSRYSLQHSILKYL